ncbi:MAG: MFS transporter [Desulfobaccales bacterium]
MQESSEVKAAVVSEFDATQMRFRWVALIFCFFGFMVAFMQRLCLGPLAPFIQADFGLTKGQIGLLASAALVGYALVLVPAGWICDKWGVRWTLSFGQIFAGLCVITMIFAHSVTTVAAVMFGAGLGLGLLSPSTTKGVVEWFSLKERAFAMGIKQTAVNAGGFVSAATLPAIALAFGWRIGFVTLGIVAIISGVLAACFFKNAPKTAPGIAAQEVKKESWLNLFKTRDMWCIIIGACALYTVEFSVMTYFVLYLKGHLMIPVITAGFLLGFIDIGGFFGKPIAGYISDHYLGGRRKPTFILLGIIIIVFTAVFALLPASTPKWVFIPCTFLFGFAAVGGAMSIYSVMISEFSGKDNAAKGYAAGMVFLIISQIVGVPIFGYLSDITHSWTWSWIYLIALAIIGTSVTFFVREERRRLST